MATTSVTYDLIARDKASSALRGVGKGFSDLDQKSKAAHGSLRNLGSMLSGMGGPFSVVGEAADRVTMAFDHVQQNGKRLATVMQGVGVGVASAGALLVAVSAKDMAAHNELKQAITNTGGAYSDYREQIERTIRSQAHFGHDDADTQEALAKLTMGLGSADRAMQMMGLAADVAAVKHVSLADASDLLVRAEAGSTRIFKQFGIELDGQGSKTEQVDRAMALLAQRLHGQAGAAVDSFAGQLKVLGTQAENFVSELGKYGPVLMAVGSGMTIVGTAMDMLAARKARQVALDEALIASENGLAAAQERVAATAGAESAAGAGKIGLLGRLGPLAAVAAVAVGADMANNYTKGQNTQNQAKLDAVAAQAGGAAALQKELSALKATGNNDPATRAAIAQLQSALKGVGESAKTTTGDLKNMGNGLEGLITHMNHMASVTMATHAATDNFQKGLNDLASTVANNGTRSLQGNTDAAIANRDALRNLGSGLLANIQAMKDQGYTTDQIQAKALGWEKQLESTATKVYGNKAAVDQLLGAYHLLPSQIGTLVKVTGADKARAEAQSVIAAIDELQARHPFVNIGIRTSGPAGVDIGGGHRYATGGLVTGGVPGQDSVRALLTPGEFVVTPDGKNLQVSGGGGTSITVNVAGSVTTERDLIQSIIKGFRDYQRRNGAAAVI